MLKSELQYAKHAQMAVVKTYPGKTLASAIKPSRACRAGSLPLAMFFWGHKVRLCQKDGNQQDRAGNGEVQLMLSAGDGTGSFTTFLTLVFQDASDTSAQQKLDS